MVYFKRMFKYIILILKNDEKVYNKLNIKHNKEKKFTNADSCI